MSQKFPLNPGGGKGDGKRPTDPKHCPWANEMDMGTFGCNRGYHVFRGGEECVYCKKTKEELGWT